LTTIGRNILQPIFDLFGKKTAKVTPSNDDIIVFNSTTNEWELKSGAGGEDNTSSNVGSGDGLALPKVGVDLPFKSLVDGVEIVITVSATELAFSIGAIAISKITGLQVELDSKIETLTNVGGFNEIVKAKVGQNVDVRTLQAGANITITQNANDLEIETNQNTRLSQMANCYDLESPSDLDFLAIVGITTKDSIENHRQIVMPQNLTLQRLSCQISVNASIASTNLNLRVNGVTVNSSVLIGAGLTGTFQDLVNTDNLLNGDLTNYQVVIAPTGSTIEFISASVQVLI